jgi:DNA-binding transcriptional LysR family regulator
MPRINLDIDVLRTVVTASQLGSFNRAAEQVGRSQSAISQQIHKLEERVGQPLFRKQGRGLALTEAGEIILAYARRILELNDEAVTAVTGVAIDGTVRFGMPGDFAETWLPAALGRFKRAHPTVRIEATVDRNTSLIERLNKGQIDLALILGPLIGPQTGARGEALAKFPMAWIGGNETTLNSNQPVPLAVFEQPCFFRTAAIAALDAAGIPWRIEFTSPSLAGLWAAVDAGLGITVRTSISPPPHLANVGNRLRLPKLPAVELCLDSGGRTLTPASARLRDILYETLPTELSSKGHAQTKPRLALTFGNKANGARPSRNSRL